MISLLVKGVKQAMISLPDTRKARRAASMALNRTLRGAVTETIKGVREDYAVKRKDVAPGISSSKANVNNLTAKIYADRKRLPLIKFQARISPTTRRTSAPRVRVRVKKGWALKPLRHAFPMHWGSRYGIAERKEEARIPTRELYGPSVHSMASSRKVMDRVRLRAHTQFESEFTRNLDRMLKR